MSKFKKPKKPRGKECSHCGEEFIIVCPRCNIEELKEIVRDREVARLEAREEGRG